MYQLLIYFLFFCDLAVAEGLPGSGIAYVYLFQYLVKYLAIPAAAVCFVFYPSILFLLKLKNKGIPKHFKWVFSVNAFLSLSYLFFELWRGDTFYYINYSFYAKHFGERNYFGERGIVFLCSCLVFLSSSISLYFVVQKNRKIAH